MRDTNENTIPLRDPMVHDLHIRVSRMEQHTQTQTTELAVLQNDMTYVKDSVGGISRGVNKILWAIGLCVLTVGTTFVLSGGLVVVTP